MDARAARPRAQREGSKRPLQQNLWVVVVPEAAPTPKRYADWLRAGLGEESLREQLRRIDRHARKRLAIEGPEVCPMTSNQRLALQSVSLGRAALLLGRLDEARSSGAYAVDSSAGHHGFAAHALHLLGDIATHPDRFDAESAEAYYRQALALAEPRGMRPLVAHCHLGLGTLSRRIGKREQADQHLTAAATMYREMEMRFWLEKAETDIKEPG